MGHNAPDPAAAGAAAYPSAAGAAAAAAAAVLMLLQEGSALARAVLDVLAGQAGLTLATSHHAELKTAADEDSRWVRGGGAARRLC
jgi:hypothetical protein